MNLLSSAAELKDKLVAGELKVTEVAQAFLAHSQKIDPQVNAFLKCSSEDVLEQAKNLDSIPVNERKSKKLFGLPIAIKDNFCMTGEETRCGSKILEGFVAPYDATVIENLKREGALLFGRTNMDEFAMGSSTEHSAFQKTKNPWDLECIPGGSSGGSAAAVASCQVPLALGSDTGGSVRQPASLCGVVGVKPTYGRVSRYGLVAFASSLDQIGPLANNVKDAALLLEVIAGHDPRDSTSIKEPVPHYGSNLEKSLKGLKAGIPKEYFIEGIDPEIEKSVKEAIAQLEKLGVEIQEISLPHTSYAVATYYIVATAEASSNLARYDGVQYGLRSQKAKNLIDLYFQTRKEGFGDEVKRRIMLGTYALSSGYYDAYYLKALQARSLLKQDFDQAFKNVDFIVTPTSPTAAFKVGEKMEDPISMYLADIFTLSVNLAGLPALSVPCGLTKERLPIGLHLIGKPFDETTLLQVAFQFESSTAHHQEKPMKCV